MDFNHTSSHFTYAYDTNIHVWVWHEWEVWARTMQQTWTWAKPNWTEPFKPLSRDLVVRVASNWTVADCYGYLKHRCAYKGRDNDW